MSNLEKNNSGKGLGRGLGSLFGSEMAQESAKDVLSNLAEEKKAEVVAAAAPAVQAAPTPVAPELSDENRIWQIPVEKLKTNQFQPRKEFDKEKIAELAA